MVFSQRSGPGGGPDGEWKLISGLAISAEHQLVEQRHTCGSGGGRMPVVRATMLDMSSLYDWAGGEDAFAALINAFYDRVEVDELLSPLFPGGVTREHRLHVIAWWCEVFGGPTRYTDELGGYERMLAKHHDLAITPEQRFRFASLMSLAADDAKLPDDPESARRSSRTSSGVPGWRSTTRNPAPRSSSARPSHAGAGARRPPTSRSQNHEASLRADALRSKRVVYR